MTTAPGPLDRLRTAAALDVAGTVRAVREAFHAGGIEGALAEARMLAGHVLGLDLTGLVVGAERPVAPGERSRIADLAARRLAGEPVQRLVGRAGFWGLDFRLSAETLVPRPDTETLVAAVSARMEAGASLRIADLGVGSGAILVALLHELPGAIGVGTDLSGDALATARANAAANGVGDRALLVRGSYGDALADGVFDAIVSNPPYIASEEVATLDAEVRLHDPMAALDGGADGLDAYREIAATVGSRLKPGGLVALEIGWRQGEDVTALLRSAGFTEVGVLPDLAGRDRVVVGRRPDGMWRVDRTPASEDGK